MIEKIIIIILVFVLVVLSYILGVQYGFHKGRMLALLEVKEILDNYRKKNGGGKE